MGFDLHHILEGMALEKLSDYGLEHMTDTEIADFLSAQRVGTLGLPSEAGPYMIPMSYGYDREDGLYFTYLEGSDSEKSTLTRRAETARFLVYSVESMFNWSSVSLTGSLREVPQARWDSLAEILESTWRPELLDAAVHGAAITVYRFEVDEQVGIRHTTLAPDLEG